MDDSTSTAGRRPLWRRFAPRTSARVQLYGAALLWLCGLSFLLVRGVWFLVEPGPGFHLDAWFVPVAVLAVVIGVLKAHFVLRRYADKAVLRIQQRGRACFFGLFRWASWGFILAMMTAGLLLRNSPLAQVHWGRALLCLIYLAVGVALLLADGRFWRAAWCAVG